MNDSAISPPRAAKYFAFCLLVLSVIMAPPAFAQCQIQDTGNCHNLDGENYVAISDLSTKPGGFVKADDVILETPQVNEICVWGVYFDPVSGDGDTHSCSGTVEDDFRVRFYADDVGGKPEHTALIAQAGGNPAVAAMLGGTYVGSVTSTKSTTSDLTATADMPLNLEVFTLTFPTMTLPTGVTIWLEVANDTDTPTGAGFPLSNTCAWWWAQSQNVFAASTGTGNEWSYSGTDFRQSGHPRQRAGETGYLALGHDWTDQVFCLSGPGGPVNFTDPAAPIGSCCDCDGVFTDGQTLAQCTVRDPQHENRWGRTLVGDQACLWAGWVFGDNCGFFSLGSLASAGDGASKTIDEGMASLATPTTTPDSFIDVSDGGFEAWSVCADNSLPDCFPGNNCLSGDFFTNYVTTCTGELVMSMCHSGISHGNYDSYMAVYHNFSDPTNCPCPSSSGEFLIQDSDEGCNGEGDAGAGVIQGLIVFPDECWTVRLGGWTDDLNNPTHGITRLDVGCIGDDHCSVPSSPPTLQSQFDPVGTAGAPEPKNRAISINAGDALLQQSVRVTWGDQPNWPGGHAELVGQEKWMTEPFQVCENSGDGLSKSPPNCGPAPGLPQKWFWAAYLVCDPSYAHAAYLTLLENYCSGSGEACSSDNDCAAGTCGVDGAIHILDQAIVPTRNANQPATYSVQVAENRFGFLCSYSDALVVTQPIWGDIGNGTGCPMAPPNGDADLVPDVTNALNKFSNGFCAPKKTRVDVEPASLDMQVNISDMLLLLNAFSGFDYPFPSGTACLSRGSARTDR